MRSSARAWCRVCQDSINNGKAGTKLQCLENASIALKEGKSVFIDRCNLEREQRVDFLQLGGSQVDKHAVVLDLSPLLCISRSVKRTGHEGKLQGGKAAAVVNRMLRKKELPILHEGFSRITFCENETAVQAAIGTYSTLGVLDTLPGGCFGKTNSDAKAQASIMKFFKKAEVPLPPREGLVSESFQTMPNLNSCGKTVSAIDEPKNLDCLRSESIPTLAFPPISTEDFPLDHEMASSIIVDKVEEFLHDHGNARLVLVDLSPKSRILSLVQDKSSLRNIDSQKFFTFAGDVTHLNSQGGVNCQVIANAVNWQMEPEGAVNSAILSAAYSSMEDAAKEHADSILPGEALAVPLPPNSPLCKREGISHIIHVLGPNMNPNRPNFLHNDDVEGYKILRAAYTSLFCCFSSVLAQENLADGRGIGIHNMVGDCSSIGNSLDLKIRRDGNDCVLEGSKRYKNVASERSSWGSWAQALYNISKFPDGQKHGLLEVSDDVVVLNDLYPKAQRHLLVLVRHEGLDCLADVRPEHLPLLTKMHNVGLKWAEQCLLEDPCLVFRLGYHSAPSLRQLHLHVISQDFNSINLKNKKHWNSFNTSFFRDSVDVIEEIRKNGTAATKNEQFLSMELRCHRCRSAHPNIPKLKLHLGRCRAPFQASLLENGRLVFSPKNIEFCAEGRRRTSFDLT